MIDTQIIGSAKNGMAITASISHSDKIIAAIPLIAVKPKDINPQRTKTPGRQGKLNTPVKNVQVGMGGGGSLRISPCASRNPVSIV